MQAKKSALLAGAMAGACLVRDGELPEQALTRDIQFEVRAETIDVDKRTVELSFSSEEPYERWWGTEILDHGKKSVRLGRLNGRAALLMDHNTRDQVGVVEKAWIVGGKGRALVRFGKSARAEEVFQDVIDNIRSLVSVGYRVLALILESKSDGEETYRITDWEPYEISIVSVPADTTVGVGREGDPTPFDPRSLVTEETEDMNMRRNAGAAAPAPVAAPVAMPAPAAPAAIETRSVAAAPATPDPTALSRDAIAGERLRANTIRMMGMRLDCAELAQRSIDEGHTIEQFVADYESRVGNASALRVAESPAIGLSERETNRYSFLRLLNAMANPTDAEAQRLAGFELECSAAAMQRGNAPVKANALRIPFDVLSTARRDLNVGTATAGGHTVATDLMSGSFIELLRNRMVLTSMGVRVLSDLNGNLAIPRQTGGATAYWVGEGAASTESQQAFDQVPLTPKTVTGYTDMTRQLLMQSSLDIENFVRTDLATVLALEIDRAGINGSGTTNQPRGILNTSGIGSVVGGANGGAPDWTHIVGLETEVSADNADIGNLGYLTNSKVRGKLKLTQKFAGTNGDPVWEKGNEMNGYRAAVTNQVPNNLVKGTSGAVCSGIIFGNWADLIIGMWGGLDVLVNPYILSGTGSVRIETYQSVDHAVRHAESFSAMVDALAG